MRLKVNTNPLLKKAKPGVPHNYINQKFQTAFPSRHGDKGLYLNYLPFSFKDQ